MEDWLEKAATKCTRYAAVHQLGLNASDNSATFRNRQPEKLPSAQPGLLLSARNANFNKNAVTGLSYSYYLLLVHIFSRTGL